MKYQSGDYLHDCECACYLRVSTKKQTNFGWQRKAINDFCIKRNITIVKEFTETISGESMPHERPIWLQAANFCEENGVALLVPSIDRMARNVTFSLRFGQMKEHGDFDVFILVPKEVNKIGYVSIESVGFSILYNYNVIKHNMDVKSRNYIENKLGDL